MTSYVGASMLVPGEGRDKKYTVNKEKIDIHDMILAPRGYNMKERIEGDDLNRPDQ
jgi:hypothetical protein